MLYSHPILDFNNGFFRSGFGHSILYAFLNSPMCTECPSPSYSA
jgi:hypothetical protein